VVGHFQEFEDEYLETMYEFHEHDPMGLVRTGELASRLGVTPASATEMVQRLATRGLLTYQAYKGVRLTEEGLIHGQKMKRRHRLAEVLLEILPFDGNAHETACRLEHAIDDDLEVALSQLINNEATDPSGRPIPPATTDIQERILQYATTQSLLELPEQATGTIMALILPLPISQQLNQRGLSIGSSVTRKGDSFLLNEQHELIVDDSWAANIFVQFNQ